MVFRVVVSATKQEGEGCGPCFSPESNYFCGNCSVGLDCVKDHRLPDAPGKCTKKSSKNQDLVLSVFVQVIRFI